MEEYLVNNVSKLEHKLLYEKSNKFGKTEDWTLLGGNPSISGIEFGSKNTAA
jgi:hypothetical protein